MAAGRDRHDALRSRSLHVLAGSALAIAGYLLAGFVHALTPYSSVLSDGAAGAVGASDTWPRRF